MARIFGPVVLIVCASLTGCAGVGNDRSEAAGEEIVLSQGPCYGFCPVFEVAVTPGGSLVFKGGDHAVAQGVREKSVSRQKYQELSETLSAFRPETEKHVEIACAEDPTDTSQIAVEWRTQNGSRRSIRSKRHCLDERAIELEQAFNSQTENLGITGWIDQGRR